MDQKEKDEILREGKEIESQLKPDPFIDSMDPPQELFDKIVKELKNRGMYREVEPPADNEENPEKEVSAPEVLIAKEAENPEKTIHEEVPEENTPISKPEKDKVVKFRFRGKAVKWAAMLCITMVGVFGVAMSSEANRVYMMKKVDSVLGKNAYVKINNSDNNVESELSEKEARDKLANDLTVELPKFGYVPHKMEFIGYEIFEENDFGVLKYQYKNNIINVYISQNNKEGTEFSAYDGQLVKTVDILGVDGEIEIWEIENSNDEKPSYMAGWEYKNHYYEISGKMEKEIFSDTIKGIFY